MNQYVVVGSAQSFRANISVSQAVLEGSTVMLYILIEMRLWFLFHPNFFYFLLPKLFRNSVSAKH